MKKKRLYRSKKDQVIAGVCGGIGEYFEIDSTIVRVIFVILALWGGLGIILYIIGMIVIPYEGEDTMGTIKKDTEKLREKAAEFKEDIKSAASDFKSSAKDDRVERSREKRGSQTFGLILILIGIFILFNNLIPEFDSRFFWPIVLIIIGLFILASGRRKGE